MAKTEDKTEVTQEEAELSEEKNVGDKNEEKEEEKEEVKEEKKDGKKSKKKDGKLSQLEDELAEQKNLYLRLAAEYDNFRKRSQREKDAIGGETKVYILSQILPVIDNFERAALNSETDAESYRKGIEMTFTQLTDIIKKLGVETFGEEGEAFDPKYHEAVMHIESEDYGENTVARVFSKGYKVGDRIIRCAAVQVAN